MAALPPEIVLWMDDAPVQSVAQAARYGARPLKMFGSAAGFACCIAINFRSQDTGPKKSDALVYQAIID